MTRAGAPGRGVRRTGVVAALALGSVLGGAGLVVTTGLTGWTTSTAYAVGTVSSMPAAAAGDAGYCKDDTGVTVVVDFTELGGDIVVRCAPGPVKPGYSGLDAFQGAGFGVSGTQRWGPAFVCRIQGRPSADESLSTDGNPDYHERCVDTPPSSAYWGYWYASNGGAWSLQQRGAEEPGRDQGRLRGLGVLAQPQRRKQPASGSRAEPACLDHAVVALHVRPFLGRDPPAAPGASTPTHRARPGRDMPAPTAPDPAVAPRRGPRRTGAGRDEVLGGRCKDQVADRTTAGPSGPGSRRHRRRLTSTTASDADDDVPRDRRAAERPHGRVVRRWLRDRHAVRRRAARGARRAGLD